MSDTKPVFDLFTEPDTSLTWDGTGAPRKFTFTCRNCKAEFGAEGNIKPHPASEEFIDVICPKCGGVSLFESGGVAEVLSAPIEELPLYINSKNSVAPDLAKLRLMNERPWKVTVRYE